MRKMGEKARREEKTFVIDKLEDTKDTGQLLERSGGILMGVGGIILEVATEEMPSGLQALP
ncbi:hypothetical protein DRN46_07115 [Thermococci archaeon]|nr:MAG: hypothetical protein DRN46_07115 [Thermococci archaeon]